MILGHIATLACKVSADNNVPFDIVWYHEDRRISAKGSHRISIIPADGTLKIAEARASGELQDGLIR